MLSADLEDISQEGFLRLLRYDRIALVEHPQAYLFKMASNVAAEWAIRARYRQPHETQWSKLTVFLEHGIVPLDNNRCENAIRPFVIGRRNWLFSDTAASANLYSLIETARANGLEPHTYLSRVPAELPNVTALEHIEALLPWNLKGALADP